jgi:hypothetical protein
MQQFLTPKLVINGSKKKKKRSKNKIKKKKRNVTEDDYPAAKTNLILQFINNRMSRLRTKFNAEIRSCFMANYVIY